MQVTVRFFWDGDLEHFSDASANWIEQVPSVGETLWFTGWSDNGERPIVEVVVVERKLIMRTAELNGLPGRYDYTELLFAVFLQRVKK